MSQWRDVTSYSRGEDRNPRTVEVRTGGLRITVTRHIHYPPDQWLLHAPPFVEHLPLGMTDLEDAKAEALRFLEELLRSTLDAVQGIQRAAQQTREGSE